MFVYRIFFHIDINTLFTFKIFHKNNNVFTIKKIKITYKNALRQILIIFVWKSCISQKNGNTIAHCVNKQCILLKWICKFKKNLKKERRREEGKPFILVGGHKYKEFNVLHILKKSTDYWLCQYTFSILYVI